MMRQASISDPTKRGSWKPEPAQANRAGSSIFHSFASSTCAPTRLRLRSNPFDSRTFVASRITVRLTPYSTHSSDSLGRYSLGWISPDRMRRARVVTISRCTRGLLFRDTLRDSGVLIFILAGPFYSARGVPDWVLLWASYINLEIISYETIDTSNFNCL